MSNFEKTNLIYWNNILYNSISDLDKIAENFSKLADKKSNNVDRAAKEEKTIAVHSHGCIESLKDRSDGISHYFDLVHGDLYDNTKDEFIDLKVSSNGHFGVISKSSYVAFGYEKNDNIILANHFYLTIDLVHRLAYKIRVRYIHENDELLKNEWLVYKYIDNPYLSDRALELLYNNDKNHENMIKIDFNSLQS